MRLLIVIFIFIITGCANNKNNIQKFTFKPAKFNDLTGWNDDKHHEVLPAFVKSCKAGKLIYKGTPSPYIMDKGVNWKNICQKALNLPNNGNYPHAKNFLEQHFTPYQVIKQNNEPGLFTGYFEIDLNGSLKKTKRFKYPIYKTPKNLDKTRHLLTREAINNGILKGRNLELVYVDDPVRLFFLHIQGSGRIHLPNGKIMRVGYAAQNGHPYRAIGKYLDQINEVNKKQVTAGSIKKWLYANPKLAIKVMEQNPSYIFFRKIKEKHGPIGAHTVPLTPLRSLAVDNKYIPLGSLLWLETNCSHCKTTHHKNLNKLMVAQDVGGAIKGPIRGDVFFGHGKLAEQSAGSLKDPGKYYVLFPNGSYKLPIK